MRPGNHRVRCVGDSFTQGTGNAAGLGWTGRVAKAARTAGYDLTAYNLGVRRERRIRVCQFPGDRLSVCSAAG